MLKNTLNSYSLNYTYSLSTIPNSATTTNRNTFKSYVTATLAQGKIPIIWVDAKKLQKYVDTQYGNTFGGHYVCIDSLNTSTNTVGIVDPNYYTGIPTTYTETVANVVAALSSSQNIIW